MLAILSILLIILAFVPMFFKRQQVLHPAFWTNAGFVGYGVGGLYFSVAGVTGAKFLNLAKIYDGRDGWFVVAMCVVFVGFAACNVGFVIGDRLARKEGEIKFRFDLSPVTLLLAKAAALFLVVLGTAYYFYFASVATGSAFGLFAKSGVYRYVAKDAGLTALPFHFLYGGALVWLLAWLHSKRNRAIGLIFLPLVMLVIISTGRITLSNAYIYSAILAFIFVVLERVTWKSFISAFFLLLMVDVPYYFWRQYTSYVYIGKADDFALLDTSSPVTTSGGSGPGFLSSLIDAIQSHFDVYTDKIGYIFRALVGGGNVPDLQQLILIIKGIGDGQLHIAYGATYLDWIRNLVNSRIGVSSEHPYSVGYRILEAYFPAKNGGPTPGMIGEAIMNFWVLAPLALVALTFLMTLLYYRAIFSRSIFAILAYCLFLIGTWALFLKVDSSLLKNFFWNITPVGLAWGCVVMFNRFSPAWLHYYYQTLNRLRRTVALNRRE